MKHKNNSRCSNEIIDIHHLQSPMLPYSNVIIAERIVTNDYFVYIMIVAMKQK